MDSRRVVITGMGVVTSLGCEIETFWRNLIGGKSGIAPVTLFDTTDTPCRIGAEVNDFDFTPYFANHRDAKRADRFIGFSVAASKMAIDQSGLDFSTEDPGRAGVFRKDTRMNCFRSCSARLQLSA